MSLPRSFNGLATNDGTHRHPAQKARNRDWNEFYKIAHFEFPLPGDSLTATLAEAQARIECEMKSSALRALVSRLAGMDGEECYLFSSKIGLYPICTVVPVMA